MVAEPLSKPVKVRPRREGEGGKAWKIVEVATGKQKGESDSRGDAESSARIRNEALRAGLRKASSPHSTSRDGGHAHGLEPLAESGTYVTRPARSPGARTTHVHVFAVRPGLRPGAVLQSSPGIDGHRHRAEVGTAAGPVAKSLDVGGEGSAAVAGPDSLRRESLEGYKGRRRRRRGREEKSAVSEPIPTVPIGAELEALAKQTKREDGKDFPPGDFAYVPDRSKPSSWKLRLTEQPGAAPTAAQVGRAVAALGPGGFRGNRVQIPSADLGAVKRRVAAAFRRANPGRDLPGILS